MKRAFDFFVALISFLVLSPVFLVLMVLVYLNVGGPFFRQRRIGHEEKIFHLFKFKSMRDKDPDKSLVTNAQRVTKLGRFMRNTSLDELPGLLNIIKGDMSLVGPRPLLVEYLPYYKPEHRKRHSIKPGLTGLAQINGRNNTTWQERLDYDALYVENHNFWLDLQILLKTAGKVFKREGAESNVDLSIVRLDKAEDYLE
ncbi:MAG: sugar transferase [Salinivirgaceae bacterium]|jgi:lipopolysaccharide/colanic/teichoic acid biosynthesis glycosyltransferase|nr:sugar transferase [Salinivirgaceae bacterium]